MTDTDSEAFGDAVFHWDIYPWVRPLAAKSVPCQQDPSLFFSNRDRVVKAAKTLCQGCPVQDECLRGALEREESAGVWGGELFSGGRPIPADPRALQNISPEELNQRKRAIKARMRAMGF